jgi:cell division protease FtsH
MDNITQLLGGRVSEELNFDDVTSGAQNDLDRATKLARKMVTEFGMSEKLGPITFKGESEDEVFLGRDIASKPHYSDKVASLIDDEVHNIIIGSYEKAKKIITENSEALARLAQELVEKETLHRKDVLDLLSDVKSHKPAKQDSTQPS